MESIRAHFHHKIASRASVPVFCSRPSENSRLKSKKSSTQNLGREPQQDCRQSPVNSHMFSHSITVVGMNISNSWLAQSATKVV